MRRPEVRMRALPLFLLGLGLAPLSAARDEEPEEPDPKALLRRFDEGTAEQCLSKLEQPEVQATPTAVRRALNTAAEECGQRAMNRALDERLLALKRTDRAAFKKEMALQKDFNVALQKLCEPFHARCPSTSAWNGHTRCRLSGSVYREAQARAIQQKRLQLSKTNASGPPAQEVSSLFTAFAKGLCRMPSEVWKAGAPPPACEGWVLAELAARLHTFDPRAEDPCE